LRLIASAARRIMPRGQSDLEIGGKLTTAEMQKTHSSAVIMLGRLEIYLRG
jgi:hypothetical protein